MKTLIAILSLVLLVMILGVFYIREFYITGDDKNIIIIGIIASLTAIVGLLITFFIFSFDIHKNNQERKKRIEALKFELKVNMQNADIILKSVSNNTIPEIRYEISILQNMFESGEIPNSNQIEFWNAYMHMKVSNNLLDKALTIQFYEHIADPRDNLSKSGRTVKIKELLGWIGDDKKITKQIENLIKNI